MPADIALVPLRGRVCEALRAFDVLKNCRLGLGLRPGEREILVDMHEWVLTHKELLSLAPNKWVSSHVASMMSRTLTAMGSHRYYFDATFGEEVCNFRVNRKAPQVDIVTHFGRFFLSDFKEFELTRRWMFFVPICDKNWRAYVVNIRDRRIELLDSLDRRRPGERNLMLLRLRNVMAVIFRALVWPSTSMGSSTST